MRKIAAFIVFIALLTDQNLAHAAKTIIKGFVPGAENLTVRFYSWEDFISNRETLIASAPIDSTGHFTITLNVFDKQTITGFFRIMEFGSQEMYIQAGKTYEIEFNAFDYKDPNRVHIPLLSTVLLKFSFKNADPAEVNQLIGAFNYDLSSFLLKISGIDNGSPSRSLMRPPKNKIDSFTASMDAKYQGFNNEFFRNYYIYSLANLRLNTYSASQTKLYNEYLYRKPLLYDNIAYMEFFSNFFTDFIYGVSNKIQPYDIVLNVNIRTNISGLIDSLGKDTLLKNEQLREAVLLLNIKDWYTSHTFKQDSLLKILEKYEAKTKFDIQGKIARNIHFMLTRFRSGSPVPEFSFRSLDNTLFTNDSLRGKYTYLLFFTTWSHPCLSELLVMEKLRQDWKDSIQFVAVSMDREALKWYYFMEENDFEFPVYHFDNDYQMAERLSLLSYPHCMMLNKQGQFIEYMAPSPSSGAKDLFNRICGKPVVNIQPHNVGH